MFPFNTPVGQTKRTLTNDDKSAADAKTYNVWTVQPGAASLDIAVGGSGTTPPVWVADTNHFCWKWNWVNSNWGNGPVPGDCMAITVDSAGTAWVVSSNHTIWSGTGGTWTPRPGAGNDIGAGGGQMWAIGNVSDGNGNFDIWKWNGSTWVLQDGTAKRVAVDSTGRAWVAKADGSLFRRTAGNTWQPISGCTNDIGTGANGDVWRIGCDAHTGGFGIYLWDEQSFLQAPTGELNANAVATWRQIDGFGTHISGSPDGWAWVTQSNATIWRRRPK